eukprot:7185354-Pyramimonas_sp.AAC.1
MTSSDELATASPHVRRSTPWTSYLTANVRSSPLASTRASAAESCATATETPATWMRASSQSTR